MTQPGTSGREWHLRRPARALRVLVSATLALAILSPVRSPLAHAAPQRIVSIVPAVTEMLFEMGAGPRVVGVGSFDRHPAAVDVLPRVGALLDPDVERILTLKPDLVVVYETQIDLRQQLERAHIPQFVYAHAGLTDITRTIRLLGDRVDTAREAERVAGHIEETVAIIRARVKNLSWPRTLLVFGRDSDSLSNVYVSGGSGFLDDVLEAAGGLNVFRAVKRQSFQVSLETIMRTAPDVILELRYTGDLDNEQVARARAGWDGLSSLPAVRTHRVHVLVGDEFVVPGPRIASAAEKLARVLHPEAFE